MDASHCTDRGALVVPEGVEDQEVSYLYQAFFLWLDPISWSLRKGKRISRSSFREGRIREILLIAAFSRPPGKA